MRRGFAAAALLVLAAAGPPSPGCSCSPLTPVQKAGMAAFKEPQGCRDIKPGEAFTQIIFGGCHVSVDGKSMCAEGRHGEGGTCNDPRFPGQYAPCACLVP